MNFVAVSLIGAGAADINVAKYMCVAGAKWENIIRVDNKRILNADRIDVKGDKNKWGICKKTNKGGRSGNIKVTMRDSDVCSALSTSWSRHHKARMGGRYSGRFFPAVLRGALDVPATRIIDDMYVREAVAVGMKAVGPGLAERKMSIEELDAVVREKIFKVE
jgi:malic enzyme